MSDPNGDDIPTARIGKTGLNPIRPESRDASGLQNIPPGAVQPTGGDDAASGAGTARGGAASIASIAAHNALDEQGLIRPGLTLEIP